MRLNKENLKDHIIKQIIALEKEWGFDPRDGYDQIKQSHFLRVIAYGEYKALNDLYQDVEYDNINEENT